MSNTPFISKTYTYALIGASHNTQKYGYKVFIDLTEAGYTVVPINPKGGALRGHKVYPALQAVTQKIDVIIFVVPPHITETLLPQIYARHIQKVWFQPGSENDAAIAYCDEHAITYVAHACMMVQRPH